jgi:hypothetical protein
LPLRAASTRSGACLRRRGSIPEGR